MTSEWEQIVRETVEMTGSAPPQLFDEQAPVLTANALSASAKWRMSGSKSGRCLISKIRARAAGLSPSPARP